MPHSSPWAKPLVSPYSSFAPVSGVGGFLSGFPLSILRSILTCPSVPPHSPFLVVILATFSLNSCWHVTANGPCLGLTFDQGGDRAQTKRAPCRGRGGQGRAGETDHLPFSPGLIWSTLVKLPSLQPLFIYSILLCPPLSCWLSLYSTLCRIPTRPHMVGPLAPYSPHSGMCMQAKALARS